MYRDEKRIEVEKIVSLHAGRRLPAERVLAEKIGVSRPRLRAILGQLETEGHVQRRHGSGTYALASQGELRSAMLLLDSALKLGDDPFISRLLEQLQGVLQGAGLQCFIQRTGGIATPPQADGVIAIGVAAHAALENPALIETPAIALLADVSAQPGKKSSLLELEDDEAGASAARKLVQSGIKTVTFFGRPSLPAVRERLGGIKRELAKASVNLDVVSCGMNYNAGYEQGRSFRVSRQKQHGIIAANDWLAVGLQAGLQSQGPKNEKSVPLVSFDGLPIAQRLENSIASLAVPLETMSIDALAELQRLNQPKATGRTIRYALTWL
ncbi:MAG TPA: GntR family transcriptional regulator [Abditibacteriaceae bacterium]|jgi:DNA-binding LacI/PurR family transcriptional regulator